MLCRHWLWCLALAASGALMAGCASAPRYPQESTRDTASARKREQAGERAAAKAAQAHAHYAAGVIHEMNEEPEAAAREFYQAALQDPGDVGMILEATRFLLENKQTDKALEVAERAAAQPNATGEIYARLGLIYSQLGKNDQAIAANRTAIQRSPDSLAGYQNLFLIHLRGKQPREALKVLDEAAARPKPHPEFLLSVAEFYAALRLEAPTQTEGAKAKALGVLNRVAQLHPADSSLGLRLADGFNLLGDSTNAARLYLELMPALVDKPAERKRVRNNLADIYVQSNDHKRAAEQLEAMVREEPTNPQVYFALGRMALEEKKLAEAVEHFGHLVLLNPDFEPGYHFLAMAQIDLNQPGEALATLEKARKKFSPNFTLEFLTATAFGQQKAYAEALKHYTAAEIIAQATDPKQLDANFYFRCGATCERKGDYAEAEKYFEKSLQLAPDFVEAMNYLGYMWAEHGMKLEKARALIEKAVKADPKNAAYLDSLAWVLFQSQQPKEALLYALKAAELSETPDATLYDHLADIYAALKQLDKAREAWRKSLSVEPNEAVQKKLDSSGGK